MGKQEKIQAIASIFSAMYFEDNIDAELIIDRFIEMIIAFDLDLEDQMSIVPRDNIAKYTQFERIAAEHLIMGRI